MLSLLAIDPNTSLKLSRYTGHWYIDSNISIGNGVILAGVAEHRSDPDIAIRAVFQKLTSLDLDHFIVTTYRGKRREWRWNGAAFAECTRTEALS